MKAIIDGKRYDTATAEEVSEWSNGCYPGDFHRVDETLYRTRKGAWFLYGEGGALTSYAVRVGNNGSGGSAAIRPLSDYQARAWLEEKQDTVAIEKYFASEVEDA